MQRETFSLTLKSTKMITPSVLHMGFVRSDGIEFKFTPGQFITFHFELDGVPYQRSYSIATIPGKTNQVEIAVSPFEGGPGTRFLFNLKPGDHANTTGPFGRLVLRDEQPARYILVATGTGVTPYRAMLPELLNRINQQGIKVIVLLGVQKPQDLLYGEDFINFSKVHPNLEFRAYYSRELPSAHQPYEHKGYVQTAFDELNINPEDDIVYLCGNPNMIDEAFAKLKDAGFATSQVRREKYISPKR